MTISTQNAFRACAMILSFLTANCVEICYHQSQIIQVTHKALEEVSRIASSNISVNAKEHLGYLDHIWAENYTRIWQKHFNVSGIECTIHRVAIPVPCFRVKKCVRNHYHQNLY